MKRMMSLVLLTFGLAAFAHGQGSSDGSQEGNRAQNHSEASASPAGLDFGDQEVQTRSKQLKIALTNNTGKPIEIRGVDTLGGHWEDFEADYDACTGEPIAAGKSCSIGVIFSPQAIGPRSAFLQITYDDPDHPQKIPLRGNGVRPDSGAYRPVSPRPGLPIPFAAPNFQSRAVALAPILGPNWLPRPDAEQVVVQLLARSPRRANRASKTGGLWLSGDVREGLARLRWILGKDADALTLNRDNRVRVNWQLLAQSAHLREVSPAAAPQVLLEYISLNEGLFLLAQITEGEFRYLLHLGSKAPTLGGDVVVASSLNLDNNYDSRINSYRPAARKLSVERPPLGFDCMIAFNPQARWFNLQTRELVQVGNISFHELAEGYAKVALGFEYLPKGDLPGAHNVALAREMVLKEQRAEVVLTTGMNRVLKSEGELQHVYSDIAAGQK